MGGDGPEACPTVALGRVTWYWPTLQSSDTWALGVSWRGSVVTVRKRRLFPTRQGLPERPRPVHSGAKWSGARAAAARKPGPLPRLQGRLGPALPNGPAPSGAREGPSEHTAIPVACVTLILNLASLLFLKRLNMPFDY